MSQKIAVCALPYTYRVADTLMAIMVLKSLRDSSLSTVRIQQHLYPVSD